MKKNQIEHQDLLKKLAWSFHKSTGLDWDDLFQEAYIAYRYALEHYDPNAGASITTFLCVHINNQLKSYYQKELKYLFPLTNAYRRDVKAYNNLNAWLTPDIVRHNISFKEYLTQDAQTIAEMIIIAGKRFLNLRSQKQIEQKIIAIMSNRGWERERIQVGIKNLKQVCSTR